MNADVENPQIALRLQAVERFLEEMSDQAFALREKFAKDAARLSSATSMASYWEFRGTYYGIQQLREEFETALSSRDHAGFAVPTFMRWLASWVRAYRFSELLEEEFGSCCVRRLNHLQRVLVSAIELDRLGPLHGCRLTGLHLLHPSKGADPGSQA